MITAATSPGWPCPEGLAHLVHAGEVARGAGEPERAPIAVGVGDEGGAGGKGPRPVARERRHPRRLPVEGAQEPDHLLPPGGAARESERRLDRLRARGVELEPVEPGRRHGADLVHQVGARGGGEAADGQLPRLRGDRLDVRRVAMAERVHADAADEVDVAVAIDVGEHAPAAVVHRQASPERETLQARGEVPLLPRHDLLGSRPGNTGADRDLLAHAAPLRTRGAALVT